MRAAVNERYGPPEVVRVVEVPRPQPRSGQVLVRVEAAAVTSGDARIRGARFPPGFGLPARLAFGVRRPRKPILGSVLAGVVEQVGAGVAGFAVGDAVCGMTGAKLGAHAEYVAVTADKLVARPATVSAEDAAGVLFGGTTALYFLRDKATVAAGMTVLVNGASGAVGTNAVQLARHFGASVVAVSSAANRELVEDLGADAVLDHTRGELERTTDTFDVVLDAVGNLTIASGRRLLRPNGVLVLAVAGLLDTVRARGRVVAGPAPERAADMAFLLELVATGSLAVVTDASYDLRDIVEAHRRVDSGRKRGNVIVRC